MYIEDIIFEAVTNSGVVFNSWDSTLIHSFFNQLNYHSRSLTEKQSVLAVRILKRYSKDISRVLSKDVEQYLNNPTFKMPIRKLPNEKTLSIVDDFARGKLLKAVFPYNEKTVEQIRKYRSASGTSAAWDADEKCWFFDLSEQNISFLLALDSFEADDNVQKYQQQISEIHNDIEKYVPMLIVEDSTPKLKNCDKNMPILTSKDIISAVFEARKKGVYTWDETVVNYIESDNLTPLTRSFLKTDPGLQFSVDSEKYNILDLKPIVQHLFPIMVVIPGGDELSTMTQSYNFFKELGLSNDEMSVMFRLPSNSHEIFNSYVKLNELNSPITSSTKVVFVSGKIPKPIFKSGIKFHGILNLGYNNVHYTLRDFLKSHENTIMYSKEKYIKTSQYGFM